MPATVLWRHAGERRDVDAVAAAVRALGAGASAQQEIAVRAIRPADADGAPLAPISGPLFGGCFSVLTGLIGTPYFPRSLDGHVVFIEDVDEHPGRLVRALNQWLQSGALRGVRALVVGHLRKLGDRIPDDAPFVLDMFATRAGVPVFHTPLVGHTSPNFPMFLGAQATIAGASLRWQGRLARRADV
jgi:muramoyltetrapeptide carboxypeptidase